MNDRLVSVRIAPANVRTVFATISPRTLGRTWVSMM
jgi:hypothetical protein